MKWQYWLLSWGILMTISLVFFAFTGMAFWAPFDKYEVGRPMALGVIHICGIIGGILAIVEWPKK